MTSIKDYLEFSALIGEVLSAIALVVGASKYLMTARDRSKTKQLAAWQIVMSAAGQKANGGRNLALADLVRDKVDLTGVDLSRAFLDEMNLSAAKLTMSDFRLATINKVNFTRADITTARFIAAHGGDVKFVGVNAQYANFALANFLHADMRGANFERAILDFTNLYCANLEDVNLEEAFLRCANLYKANLAGIKNWRSIRNLENANVQGVQNAPRGFLDWAIREMGAEDIDPSEWFTRHDQALKNAKDILSLGPS